MKFGYARISKPGQRYDRQQKMLEEYGCDKIFYETASGAKTDRKELTKMINQLRKGDKVIVVKLSRIGRSTKHLIELITEFKEREVEFISLTENLDTSTPMGKFTFTVMAAMAEMERDLIRERTKEGLDAARKKGKRIGRPKGFTQKTKMRAIQLLALHREPDLTVKQVMAQLGIGSTRTYYRYRDWALENERKKAI